MSAASNGRYYVPPRHCHECKKPYLRSNRFRMWKFTSEPDASELPKWQKVDVILCTHCFNNRQIGRVIQTAELSTRVIKLIGFK